LYPKFCLINGVLVLLEVIIVYIFFILWLVFLLYFLFKNFKLIDKEKKFAFKILVLNIFIGILCFVMSQFNDKYPLGFKGFIVLMIYFLITFSYIFLKAKKK
jgi:hypothetical protein